MIDHGYKTKGKQELLDFLKNHSDKHFTVEEVIKELAINGKKVSRSSVYRQISRMYENGDVRRFESHDKNNFVYQYANVSHDCEAHYHLKCTKCGKLLHIECSTMNEMKKHIYKDHGFIIGGNSIINGICRECNLKNQNNIEEDKIDC